MLFIPQKKSRECGICIVKFVLKNYKNITISNKISTNYVPLSTISILLSTNLVFNKLKLVENKYFFEPIVFPEIIHCKFILSNHYILLIKKIDGLYLVYDPCSMGFKLYNLKKIRKVMTGYIIELPNLSDCKLDNKFYIAYPIRIIIRFVLFDLCLILLIFFLFY